MDNERVREICLALPHVVETLNWGHVLCFWAGDRELGGKMFAVAPLDGNWDGRPGPVLSFHCGAERFDELLEREGMIPAPHLARAYWVAMERWDVMRPRELEEELRLANRLIFEKLPKRTKAVLALPEKERANAIGERKKVVTARDKAKKGAVKATKGAAREARAKKA
jgi:predicted DNA-binding protein (MmcQ/YjbR family)